MNGLEYNKLFRLFLVSTIVLLSGSMLVTCAVSRGAPSSVTSKDTSSAMPSPQRKGSGCPPLSSKLAEPFYGMEFVPIEDLAAVKALNIEVVLASFKHNATPDDWLAYLDAAQALDLLVIPWLWPQGWEWDGTAWQIDAQATRFLQTIDGHPATLAVYALHEPYWNACEGCGYSTAQQQELYNDIKAIADIPIYSEIQGIAYWNDDSPATAFADGICDLCQSSYYAFKDGGIYERNELIDRMHADIGVAEERAPCAQVVWTMPAMVYSPDHFRMPTAEEILDHTAVVYAEDIAGAWWYMWKFDGHYDDVLSNHPELFAAVSEAYQQYVVPQKPEPPTATPKPDPTATVTAMRYRAYLPLAYELP